MIIRQQLFKGICISGSSVAKYFTEFFMDEKVKSAIFRQVAKEPFAQKFGLQLTALDEGYSKVEMTFTPDMENIFGLAHGGALFALIDEAFETASNSHGTMAVALNMNITYISPPSPGSALIAEAQELHQTQKTSLCEIKVFDDQIIRFPPPRPL